MSWQASGSAFFTGMKFYSLLHYFRFYWQAVTKYQLHSPAIFSLVMDVLEDTKKYYAFEDILAVRRSLLWTPASGDAGQKPIREGIHLHAPERQTGERLFKLVKYFAPDRILMLGSGASIGCLYAAAASQSAVELWEGQKVFEPSTSLHLERINKNRQVRIIHGRQAPIWRISENDLLIFFSDFDLNDPELLKVLFSQAPKAWVMLNMYTSPERNNQLKRCKQFPKVRASVDFFDVTVLLPDERLRETQHLKVVSAWQKMWKFY